MKVYLEELEMYGLYFYEITQRCSVTHHGKQCNEGKCLWKLKKKKKH